MFISASLGPKPKAKAEPKAKATSSKEPVRLPPADVGDAGFEEGEEEEEKAQDEEVEEPEPAPKPSAAKSSAKPKKPAVEAAVAPKAKSAAKAKESAGQGGEDAVANTRKRVAVETPAQEPSAKKVKAEKKQQDATTSAAMAASLLLAQTGDLGDAPLDEEADDGEEDSGGEGTNPDLAEQVRLKRETRNRYMRFYRSLRSASDARVRVGCRAEARILLWKSGRQAVPRTGAT